MGGILGINQSQLRSIIAYSSISHIGWIIRILYVNKPTLCLIYYIIYVFLITPIFILLNSTLTKNLKNLNSIMNLRPIIKISLVIMLLSLAGLPPFTGFIPKLVVLLVIFNNGAILGIILIIGSLITLYFYLNVSIVLILNLRYGSIIIKNGKGLITFFTTRLLSLAILPLILLYAMTIFNKS